MSFRIRKHIVQEVDNTPLPLTDKELAQKLDLYQRDLEAKHFFAKLKTKELIIDQERIVYDKNKKTWCIVKGQSVNLVNCS